MVDPRQARRGTMGLALVVAVVAASGCQVRGIVGSNETASGTASGSGSGAGATGGENDADSAGDPSAVTQGSGQGSSTPSGGLGGSSSSSEAASDSEDSSWLFDVQPIDDPTICAPPTLVSCDDESDTWYHAMGLGCDEHDGSSFGKDGAEGSMLVYDQPLGTGHFAPREGSRMVLLSTGRAAEIPLTMTELAALRPDDCGDPQWCPSTGLGEVPRAVLPAPIEPRPVDDVSDCADDPTLIGEGDCSNSLAEHWTQGEGANDYVELRLRTTVPPYVTALQYDFAFFSSEYPLYTEHGAFTEYNDMYIAWLESESWTGNISFDDELNPITVQSAFLDYRSPSEQCPECEAPQLEGFAMEAHAGTKWLTTKAPVASGETIELIFALFDLTDPMFDSVVVLDNFQWSCSDGPPVTSAG